MGWVAMWWPLRHLGRVYRKLSDMPVEIRAPAA